MSLYQDMATAAKAQYVIPVGTYLSGSNPSAAIVDRDGYQCGVLFLAEVGAVTNAQTFSVNVSNSLSVVAATADTLTTALAGANNDLVYTAVTAGASSGITVAYVNPLANNQTLACTVAGKAISVSLATGAAGAITTTATLLAAIIAATPAAAALVTVANAAGNDGSGTVTALSAAAFSGGVDAQNVLASPYTLVAGTDDYCCTPNPCLSTLGIVAVDASGWKVLFQYHGFHRYVQLVSTGAGVTGATYAVYAFMTPSVTVGTVAPTY